MCSICVTWHTHTTKKPVKRNSYFHFHSSLLLQKVLCGIVPIYLCLTAFQLDATGHNCVRSRPNRAYFDTVLHLRAKWVALRLMWREQTTGLWFTRGERGQPSLKQTSYEINISQHHSAVIKWILPIGAFSCPIQSWVEGRVSHSFWSNSNKSMLLCISWKRKCCLHGWGQWSEPHLPLLWI